MRCLRHGGNEYVDSLRNPHGCVTIPSSMSAALVYNIVSTVLASQVRRDKGYLHFYRVQLWWPVTHMFGYIVPRHVHHWYIIYMGSRHNTPMWTCCDVNSTTISGYMAYIFVYMGICRYGDDCTHIYIITDGFMFEDAGPLVKEELCITLRYMQY